MSNIVVCTMISIDGYTEGSGGEVSAMPMDMAFAEHNAERVRAAGRLLFGATSYRGMVTYWPQQVDNPDAIAEDRYIASRYAGGMPITVVSDTLTRDDIEVWGEQTTIVRRSEAHAAVQQLRESDGDVLIFGSRTLWTDLLAHGLVDDLYVMVGAKVVAGDHHAFAGLPVIDLRLVGVRTFADSSSVVLHYRPDNAR